MIPTTDLKPTYLFACHDEKESRRKEGGGGIEYKGRLYLSFISRSPQVEKNIHFDSKELWFIAKLHEKNKFGNLETIPFLAKIWATKNNKECTYNKDIESMLSDVEQDIYCL